MALPYHVDGAAAERRLSDEERRKEDDRKQLDALLGVATAVMSMYEAHEDPVIRHTLFLDKINILLMAGLAMFQTMGPKFTPEQQVKVTELATMFNREIKSLSDWVLSPTYSPDRPFGQNLMRKAAASAHACDAKGSLALDGGE